MDPGFKIADHTLRVHEENCVLFPQAFMEEMTRKQPDVDTITKTHKRKAAVETQIQSQIPVLEKGRPGSMYPTNNPS